MKHVVMLAIMGLFITFAGQQSAYAIQAVSEEVPVKSLYKVETLQRVADNVIIMFDSSGSMGEKYGNTNVTKLEVAKNILGKRADLMPDTMGGLNIGLYSYTPSGETSASSVYYEMQPFDRAKFKQAIGTPTLLVNGLRKVDSMLKDLQGRTVVFLFTDGTHSDDGATTSPFELAQNIVKKHDVSFQIVSTTDIPKQIEMMKKVSTLGTSSKVHSFRSLVNRPEVYSAAVFASTTCFSKQAKRQFKVASVMNSGLWEKSFSKTREAILFSEDTLTTQVLKHSIFNCRATELPLLQIIFQLNTRYLQGGWSYTGTVNQFLSKITTHPKAAKITAASLAILLGSIRGNTALSNKFKSPSSWPIKYAFG
jgi:hypothetical protein